MSDNRNRRNNNRNKQTKVKTTVENGVFIYNGPITLDQLCKKIGVPPAETIKYFLMQGKMISLNTVLSDELIAVVSPNINLDFQTAEIAFPNDFTATDIFSEKDVDPRAPVVTIMGHVDHGKTTLIDCIRHSNITGGEHGGITQEIGAYQKTVDGKKITFIDTPGHEAFTAMRARGASVTDIVVLIVAADDGVKPQTIEAIDHARAAEVPIIVAINKIDKPGANPEKVRSELSAQGLLCEEWGGDTMMFEISAKKNIGVDKLLSGILTLAELLDLKATDSKAATGSVIEAKLDKKEGAKATLLVQNGTLHVSDYLAVGEYYCKVRKMTNEYDKPLKEAGPSTPVSITGLSGVPVAGDRFMVFSNERDARDAANRRAQALIGRNEVGVSLADIAHDAASGELSLINLVIKADTQGSAEAIKSSLEKINVEGTKLQILHCASGDVTLGDLTLASASHAIVLAFSVKINPVVKEQAKEKKVEIREYNIIYSLIEDIEAALRGTLGPTFQDVIYGHLEVRQLFKASRIGQILGCMVTDGKIMNSNHLRVYRHGDLVLETKVGSLKRFQDDVKEVTEGHDCGLTLNDKFDCEPDDIIEAWGTEEVRNG